MCGGTLTSTPAARRPKGLSPRVRGNHHQPVCRMGSDGSIPACAGEPPARAPQGRTPGVYPRVCGGTGRRGSHCDAPSGLSPRVRGNRANAVLPYPIGGSIPACAGEPDPGLRHQNPPWVYPRVCGGTASTSPATGSAGGLSPRVRGNRWHPAKQPRWGGSIPACAGEPASASRARRARLLFWVYPRVCGGTLLPSRLRQWVWGLSPRVRGNPPRLSNRMVSSGLSPRVRGNRKLRRPAGMRSGSIPACAGEPFG